MLLKLKLLCLDEHIAFESKFKCVVIVSGVSVFKKIILVMGVSLCAVTAQAAEFVYTPINPSFGGNPNNTSHLLSIAGAIKNSTASDYIDPTTGDSGDTTDSTKNDAADLFVRQLQGRLLSALASQVTDSIFGDNPQESGKITFGDTEVSFSRENGNIKLTISDFGDGTVTEIIVPQLIAASSTS